MPAELDQGQVDSAADQGQGIGADREAAPSRTRDGQGRFQATRQEQEAEPRSLRDEPADDEREDDETISRGDDGEDGQPAAEDKGDGEPEAEPEAEPDAWIDDSVLDLAESAGLTRDDLGDFESKYELQRALRIQDRRYLSGLEQQTRGPAPAPPQPAAQQYGSLPAELPKFDPEVFDEGTLKALDARDRLFLGLHEAQRQQLAEAIGYLQQQQAATEFARFNDLLDGLHQDALFGKFGEVVPGSRQARNRDVVLKAYSYLPQRQPTMAMVERAAQVDFWKELRDQERQQMRKAATRQSKRVLRTGRSRSVASDDDDFRGGISAADREALEKGTYRR